MKVIFLDVDGVLNTIRSVGIFGSGYLCEKSILLIRHIVDRTDAKIVLSSTWRKYPESKELLEQSLKNHELSIYDFTPIISLDFPTPRNEEIKLWLEANPIDDFVILDDDPRANIDGHFFRVNEDTGITIEIANEVISFLNPNNFSNLISLKNQES